MPRRTSAGLAALLVLAAAAFCGGLSCGPSGPSGPGGPGGAGPARDSRPVLNLVYFYSPDCGVCAEIRDRLFPRVERELGVRVSVAYFNIDQSTNLPRLLYLEKKIGREGTEFPVIFLGDTLIAGEENIKKNFLPLASSTLSKGVAPDLMDRYLRGYSRESVSRTEMLSKLNAFVVISSGLIDGINPCAFSTLIFLISFLFFLKADRRQIVLVGTFYTLGVFLTYLAVGAGFFKILKALAVYKSISLGIKFTALGLLALFVGLSVYDIVRYLVTRKADFVLSLPKPLRKRIHETIRQRVGRRTFFLSAFALGVLLSLFELACTGQIYLPTILYILQIPELKAQGILYLVLYNVCFILPLVAVFAIAYFGATSKAVEGFFKRQLLLVKLLTLGLFVFLFLYLAGLGFKL